MDYDRWCARCEHYRFNLNEGIICALSNTKPKFEEQCKYFSLDPVREKNLKESKELKKIKIKKFTESQNRRMMWIFLWGSYVVLWLLHKFSQIATLQGYELTRALDITRPSGAGIFFIFALILLIININYYRKGY